MINRVLILTNLFHYVKTIIHIIIEKDRVFTLFHCGLQSTVNHVHTGILDMLQ